MSREQATLDALDEAGRLIAPILQSEATDCPYTPGFQSLEVPSVHVAADGKFRVHGFVGRDRKRHFISAMGEAETLSAAFVRFLAARFERLNELARDDAERAEFEAFKAQRQQVAA